MITNRDRKSFGSRRKKFQNCSDDWHRWRFWSAFRNFGTHFAEIFRMSKSSWSMDPTRSLEMTSCSAIDLAEIRRFSKIRSWSIFSGVVTVLGRSGRGATQVEKSPPLNWATQFFFMVSYDGACSTNIYTKMAWISFSALLFRGEKNSMTAGVSILLESRASPDMLPFSLYNKKRLAIRHMNRPPFPTTLSIPFHDIGKWVGLRTYQHPLVFGMTEKISESFRKNLSNIPGRHDIKVIQKTFTVGTAHTSRKALHKVCHGKYYVM